MAVFIFDKSKWNVTRKEAIGLLERKRQKCRSSLRYTYTPTIEWGILVVFGEVPISTTRRASTLPAYWYARRLPRSLGSTFYLRNDSRSQGGNKLVRCIPWNENITCFGWWCDLMNVTFCLLTAPDGFGIGRFIKSTTVSEIVGRFMPGMRHISNELEALHDLRSGYSFFLKVVGTLLEMS